MIQLKNGNVKNTHANRLNILPVIILVDDLFPGIEKIEPNIAMRPVFQRSSNYQLHLANLELLIAVEF
jgi:hypothetical protein